MKKYLLAILIFTACETSEKPVTQTVLTVEEEEIAKALIQGVFDDIWAGFDSTKLLDYHTNDFILLEHGEVWNNDSIWHYLGEQNTRMNKPVRTNRMDFMWVEKYGESIQMGYHNYADYTQGDSVIYKGQWLESALAVPTENGWRLKMMHSTRVPRN